MASKFQNQQQSVFYNQKQMDNALLQLSRNLVPAEKDLSDARQVADKIFRMMHKDEQYEVDRQMIFGSIEKKTALPFEFDLDGVIFLNNITTEDFPKILDYFKKTLYKEESISAIRTSEIKEGLALLQVTVDGFDCDIVPAINFSQDPDVQQAKVLAEIRKLAHPSKEGHRWSTSLIFQNVNFIKKQSAFAHDIIRLAKLWNHSTFIKEYVAGRSAMIELIAVDAANKVERNYGSRSNSAAFREFLKSMSDLKNLEITFDHKEIESRIKSQRPLVLDPINPYNNFAYDLKRNANVRLQFEKFAKVTLQILDAGNFSSLFQLQMSSEILKWIVNVYDNVETSKRIKVIVRNTKGNQHLVKVYKHFFSCNLKILNSNGKTEQELKDDVLKSIDEFESGNGEWFFRSQIHERYDVTFEMPSGDGRFLVKCSCELENFMHIYSL